MVNAGSKFPIEQRHDRIGVQLAKACRLHHFYFVNNSGLVVDNEPVNALTLITEMLCFDRIVRIWSGDGIFLVLRVDPDNVGSASRMNKSKYRR